MSLIHGPLPTPLTRQRVSGQEAASLGKRLTNKVNSRGWSAPLTHARGVRVAYHALTPTLSPSLP
jgi:hypothetical protein